MCFLSSCPILNFAPPSQFQAVSWQRSLFQSKAGSPHRASGWLDLCLRELPLPGSRLCRVRWPLPLQGETWHGWDIGWAELLSPGCTPAELGLNRFLSAGSRPQVPGALLLSVAHWVCAGFGIRFFFFFFFDEHRLTTESSTVSNLSNYSLLSNKIVPIVFPNF